MNLSRNIVLNKNVNPHEEVKNWVRNAILNVVPNTNETIVKNFYLNLPPQHIIADYALSTFFLKVPISTSTKLLILS